MTGTAPLKSGYEVTARSRTRSRAPSLVALMMIMSLLAPVAQAWAQATQVFTTNTAIADTNLTFDGMHIVVRGCTVTIDGVHSFASLTVERNASNVPGVVTHSAIFSNREVVGVWLDVAGDVFVQGAVASLVGSRIDANGRGFPAATGPGAGISNADRPSGGGHGGAGGNGGGGALGGSTYGDFAQPTTIGSGGGTDTSGGIGGGVLRLSIAGTLTVDGSISANGSAGNGNEAAGGAGGSIWIECSGLFGSGLITANGGASNSPTYSGGGGGGRIALYTCAVEMPSANITANGGAGWQAGQPGSIGVYSDSIEFVSYPQPAIVNKARSASFSVSATGNGELTYQWFRNELPISDGPGISGSTTDTLQLTDVICLDDAGQYRVRVIDACGPAFSLAVPLIVSILADINHDCKVNGSDLALVLGAWGPCPDPENCPADLNGDGIVNGADLALVLGNWTG